MDQGWKRFPLLMFFLIHWRNSIGFEGEIYSNSYPQSWKPSDHAPSPSLPQYVEIGVSSSDVSPGWSKNYAYGDLSFQSQHASLQNAPEAISPSTFGSQMETASRALEMSGPYSSFLLSRYSRSVKSLDASSLPSPSLLSSQSMGAVGSQSHTGALGFASKFASLGMSGHYSDSVQSPGTSGQLSPGYSKLTFPPLVSAQSTGAVALQSSTGALGTASHISSPGISGPYSGNVQSPSTSSQPSPGYSKLSYPPLVSSMSTGVVGSQTSSAAPLGGTGSSTSHEVSSHYSAPVQSPSTSSQLSPGHSKLSFPPVVSGQSTGAVGSQSSTGTLGTASHFAFQGVSGHYSGSVQSPGTSSQLSPGYSKLSFPAVVSGQSTGTVGSQSSTGNLGSAGHFSSQGMSGPYSGHFQSPGTPSQLSPVYSKLSLPAVVSGQSTGTVGSQTSSTTHLVGTGSLTSHGISGHYSAPVTSPSTSSLLSPGHSKLSFPAVVSGQPTGTVGSQTSSTTHLVGTGSLTSHGMSGHYSGPVQSQGTSSLLSPGHSKLSFPAVVSGQSTGTVGSQSSTGTLGTAGHFSSQGMSGHYSAPVQSPGTSSQLSPGYSKLSFPAVVSGQSTGPVGSQTSFTTHLVGTGSLTSHGMSGHYSAPVQSSGTSSLLSPGHSKLSFPAVVSGQSTGTVGSQSSTGTLGTAGHFSSQGMSGHYSAPVQSSGSSQLSPGHSKLSFPAVVSGQSTGTVGSQTSSTTHLVGTGSYVSHGVSGHYSAPVQSPGTSSQLSPGHSKLAFPPVVSSQATGTVGAQSSTGTQGTASHFAYQGESGPYSAPVQSLGTSSLLSPRPSKLSFPHVASGQSSSTVGTQSSTSSQLFPGYPKLSVPHVVSDQSMGTVGTQSSSGAVGTASRFAFQGVSGPIQSPGTSSQLSSVISKLLSSPLVVGQSTGSVSSTSALGTAGHFASQATGGPHSGSSQFPGTSSQFSPGYTKLSSPTFSRLSTRDQGVYSPLPTNVVSQAHSQTSPGAQLGPSRYMILPRESSSVSGSSPQTATRVSSSPMSLKWQPPASSWTQIRQVSDTSAPQTYSSVQTNGALSHPVSSVAKSDLVSASLRTRLPLSEIQKSPGMFYQVSPVSSSASLSTGSSLPQTARTVTKHLGG